MCNIAAYVGDRPAAPILIEMIRHQEGLNGGFFTGLTTVDHGRIEWRKRCGDLTYLLDNTDAASLKGNTGLIHSRTPGGCDDRWAHPFISHKGGDPEISLVINGSFLRFADRTPGYTRLAEEVLSEGYRLDSVINTAKSKISLGDGYVHACDLMCQLIMRNMDKGKDEPRAMADAFCEMPAEFVCLLLSKSYSDRIFFCRVSMPLFVGFAPHGAYLASSPTAFPEDAVEPMLIPPLTSGYVTKDGYCLSNYGERFPERVLVPDSATVCRIYSTITEALEQQPQTIPSLAKLVRSSIDFDGCIPAGAMVYETLYSLKKQGRLIIGTSTVDGAREGLTAPRCTVRLTDTTREG